MVTINGHTTRESRYKFLYTIFIKMRGVELGNASSSFIQRVGDILHNYPITLMTDPDSAYLDELEDCLNREWVKCFGYELWTNK